MGNWRNWTVRVLLNLIFQHFLVFIGSADGTDYTGYKLYEVTPVNLMQEMLLRDVQDMGYDFWGDLRFNATKVLVPPEFQDEFEDFMYNADILTRIALDDVGDIVDRQSEEEYNTRRYGADFDFDRFPRYDEVVEFMQSLVQRSSYARMTTIGTSFEGRAIYAFQFEISNTDPVIFIDATMHAREWAAPLVALYLMKKVVDCEYALAGKVSIYIVPVANPDGYEYSHVQERFWRKTRSKYDNSECYGVDPNRNFDSHWSEYGADPNPCSGTFPGYGPATEPEVRAVQDTILALKPTLYISLHSFGALLLYPWGFSYELPPNWRELDDLAHRAADEIQRVNGQVYTIGSATNVLYFASGGSDDWAMEKAQVPLSYTIELPDYGSGFVVPVDKIKPMVKETFEGFKVFLKHVCARRYPGCELVFY
ncbi:hypothetical protein KM043_011762 [Ampulex compressa]|nr:hypothetical protein KM043_011762 [Ampulex compressa]